MTMLFPKSEEQADWEYGPSECAGDYYEYPEDFEFGNSDMDDEEVFETAWNEMFAAGYVVIRLTRDANIDAVEQQIGVALIRQKVWSSEDSSTGFPRFGTITEILVPDDDWAVVGGLTFGGGMRQLAPEKRCVSPNVHGVSEETFAALREPCNER